MTICGLWHGASWGFILWGASYGLLLIISLLTKSIRKKITKLFKVSKYLFVYKIFRITIVFSLVTLLWILFRANTLTDALIFYKNLFLGWNNFVLSLTNILFLRSIYETFGITTLEFFLSIMGIIVLITIEALQSKYNIFKFLKSRNIFVRWTLYYAILVIIIFYGAFNSSQGFIYMQF